MSDEYRKVYMGLEETETPPDLGDGEIVEVIRGIDGGPRDGAVIGLFLVTRLDDGEIGLRGPLPAEWEAMTPEEQEAWLAELPTDEDEEEEGDEQHEVRYVGPEHFTDPDEPLGGIEGDGMGEAAAVLVEWIEHGCPPEVTVATWASADGRSGRVKMRALYLVETALQLLAAPLPMPDHLAAKVRAYVATTPVEPDVPDDEPLTYSSALYDLERALAWRQEHDEEVGS